MPREWLEKCDALIADAKLVSWHMQGIEPQWETLQLFKFVIFKGNYT